MEIRHKTHWHLSVGGYALLTHTGTVLATVRRDGKTWHWETSAKRGRAKTSDDARMAVEKVIGADKLI